MGFLLIFNQSRSCKQLLSHTTLCVTSPRLDAKIYYYYHNEIKIVSTNIYGGTMQHNFEIYKILFFFHHFWVIFGLWVLLPSF
jgi:hypothetical protein